MDPFGTLGGLWTNKENQEFAEEMASTQYQRAVKDMKAAGLNPMVMYGPGGGGQQAAAPGGQQSNPVMPGDMAGSVRSVIDARNAMFQGDNLEAENALKKAQTDVEQTSAKIRKSEADVIQKENKVYSDYLDTDAGKIGAAAKKASGGGKGGWIGSAGAAMAQYGNAVGGWASALREAYRGDPVLEPPPPGALHPSTAKQAAKTSGGGAPKPMK